MSLVFLKKKMGGGGCGVVNFIRLSRFLSSVNVNPNITV